MPPAADGDDRRRAAAASPRHERAARGAPPPRTRRRLDARLSHAPHRCAAGLPAYALAVGVVGAVVLGAWLRSPLVMLVGPAGGRRRSWSLAVLPARRHGAPRQEFFLSFAQARGLTLCGPDGAAAADSAARQPATAASAGTGCRARSARACPRVRPRPLRLPRPQAAPATSETLDLAPLHDLRRRPRAGHRRCTRACSSRAAATWSTGSAAGAGSTPARAARSSSRARRCTSAASCGWSARRTTCGCCSSSRRRSSSWLAEHPLQPCFEYRAGTLVVYLERRLEDAGRLGWLLDATAEIARRLQRRGERGRPAPAPPDGDAQVRSAAVEAIPRRSTAVRRRHVKRGRGPRPRRDRLFPGVTRRPVDRVLGRARRGSRRRAGRSAPWPALGLRRQRRGDAADSRADRPRPDRRAPHAGADRTAARSARGARDHGRVADARVRDHPAASRTRSRARS